MKGMSRDFAKYNITFNNLLPERLDTDRQKQLAGARSTGKITVEEARYERIDQIPAGRMGRPPGRRRLRVLMQAAGGIHHRQNLQLDGGAYPAIV